MTPGAGHSAAACPREGSQRRHGGPGCREALHESGQGNGPCSVTTSRMAHPLPLERCRPRLPDLGEHDSAKLAVARPRTCLSGTRTAALSAGRAQSTGAGLQASLCAWGPRGPVGASAASRLLVGKASALPSPAPAPLRTRWEQPCGAVLSPLSGADTKGHSPAGHGTFPGRHCSVRCAEGLGSHGRCPGLRGTTGPAAEPCDSQPCELVRGRPGVPGDPPPRSLTLSPPDGLKPALRGQRLRRLRRATWDSET